MSKNIVFEDRHLETKQKSEEEVNNHLIYIDSTSDLSAASKFVQNHFNKEADQYDERLGDYQFHLLFDEICQKYNFAGTIIDIGCGTGLSGKTILKYNNGSRITGIDFAEEMAKKAIQSGYANVYVGLMEEIVPYLSNENKKFDHVIILGVIYHLSNDIATNFLSSLFEIAEKSITLEIDEITDEFLANIKKIQNFRAPFFNNIPIVERFHLPNNWKIVHKEKKYMWKSATTKDKIYGIFVRYEKIVSEEIN
ncbi:S-adenosyl-L-methionine-dependent methyltransferase [Gigaspora rosea]|uniref:S-adenosyl-L-methionine-dependent methyltransferase n=1 Tax=Gigaspora rosea TaxID=44941 RepID=A0A397VLT3_9GLOM|nr:S-adenosyl-L-methionine-dependent methyltransferase [Gigaspora rosea]